MYEKIRFELFVIKEVIRVAWMRVRLSGSLKPVKNMLFRRGKYQVDKGVWKRGNYYTYIKDKYSC